MQGKVALSAMALTVGLCAALCSTAQAAPTWLPAQNVRSTLRDTTTGSIAGVQVASDPAGNAIAVWERVNPQDPSNPTDDLAVIEAAFRPAGGSFGEPQLISGTPSPSLPASNPDVGMDAQGRALVVWRQSNGTNQIIQARVRNANGSLSPIDPLMGTEAGNDAQDPKLAVSASGRAAVAWERTLPNQVYGTTGSVGGGFEPPDVISPAGGTIWGPTVAVDGAGNAIFAWERDLTPGTWWIVEARPKPVSSGFGAVAVLSPNQDHKRAELPRVAFDSVGRATVVWQFRDADADNNGDPNNDPDTQVINFANRTVTPNWAAGAFSGPGEIPAAQTTSNFGPDVVVDAANTAVVVWTGEIGGNYAVQSASRQSGGGFSNRQVLSGPGSNTFSTDLTMSPNGDTVAAWQGSFGGGPAVQAARRPAGIGTLFGATDEDIELPTTPAPGSAGILGTPELANDNEGNAIAVWGLAVCPGPTYCDTTPRFAGLDAAPPTLFSVAVPGSGVAGQGIGMAAAAVDRWSGAGIGWNFGDGATAAGGAVTHAYGLPGTYNVGVTATDAVGNASSATRTVQVQAPPPGPPPPRVNRIQSAISVGWSVRGKRTTITRLRVRQVPRGGRVQLRCTGKRCKFKRVRAARPRRGQVNALKALKRPQRTMRAGQTLEVRITKSGWIGKVVRYKMRRGKLPKSSGTLCLPIGKSRPQRRC